MNATFKIRDVGLGAWKILSISNAANDSLKLSFENSSQELNVGLEDVSRLIAVLEAFVKSSRPSMYDPFMWESH